MKFLVSVAFVTLCIAGVFSYPVDYSFDRFYDSVSYGVQNNVYSSCYKTIAQSYKRTLDDAVADTKKCLDTSKNDTPSTRACYQISVRQIKTQLSTTSQLAKRFKCEDDNGYTFLMRNVKAWISTDEPYLIPQLKSYIEANIAKLTPESTNNAKSNVPAPAVLNASPPVSAQATLAPVNSLPFADFGQIYDDVTLAIKTTTSGCFRRLLINSEQILAKARADSAKCISSDTSCYKIVLDNINNFFTTYVDSQTAGVRCYDSVFGPISYRASELLKLSDSQKIDGLKAFGNSLNGNNMNNVAPPAASIPSASVVPQANVPVPIAENVIDADFVKIYQDMKNKQPSSSCFKADMVKSQQGLENIHTDAARCFQFIRKAQSNACFKTVLNEIIAHFDELGESVSGARCSDEVLDSIRGEASIMLKNTESKLVAAVKAFATTAIYDDEE